MIDEVKFDFSGLVPAIIQNENTMEVLMLGYMDKEALEATLATKKAYFFSRSRQKLWFKGETSGNFLELVNIGYDCDKDALLVRVNPMGPTCHTGEISCFSDNYKNKNNWLQRLEGIIEDRKKSKIKDSYVARLFEKGLHKITQKVGEEATEVVIESIAKNETLFKEECADLIFHLLILLNYHNLSLADITKILEQRHKGE